MTAPRRTTGDLQGAGWTWLAGAAVTTSALLVLGLVVLIAARGLGHFWPGEVRLWTHLDRDGVERRVLGVAAATETLSTARWLDAGPLADPALRPAGVTVERLLVKRGNRDRRASDFQWIDLHLVRDTQRPATAVMVERAEWGDAIGLFEVLIDPASGTRTTNPEEALRTLADGRASAAAILRLRDVDGSAIDVRAEDVIRAWRPNAMSLPQRLRFYFGGLHAFLTGDPREANTEGGVFPAIFGTVLMTLMMTVLVTPMGVIAALYLHEFAGDGHLVRLIRISVANLAGVPAIIYGVFGLGFLVYVVGGGIDALFYADRLPTPTFGTPGLLWASLTLALLTVPVVIVATEEGLARVPAEVREGSYALGATRAETLLRVVLPMATPSLLTGLILAVARAAGEVAPLMLVGVVKLAPELPVDGEFPWLHLERKFMHLGFHIYDVGFQSPNVDAARPLVYATALLLLLIVMGLNLAAILLRNRIGRRYGAATL